MRGAPPRPTAAPSCRRADATPLQSLPEGIGELRSLKNLCVATRCVHWTLVDRPATVRRRFIDRCKLEKLPDSICHLTISSLCARLSDVRCIRNPIRAARAHRRDVSSNAMKELPACVCNMSNLTSLYAPPEASIHLEAFVAAPSRALVPQERGAQQAASAARPRKLPIAALRVRPLHSAVGHVPL